MTTLELRIDWADMDLFGHVNNVAFFRYVQAARVHFWEQVGIGFGPDVGGEGAILASTACQFRQPLSYPGQVHISTFVAATGTTSFELRHRLHNQAGQLVAEAQDVVVMFDYTAQKKVAIQQALRTRLLAEEEVPPAK